MADDENQLKQSRKAFLEEFVKIKVLIETGGKPKKISDKAGFLNSIRRILGL